MIVFFFSFKDSPAVKSMLAAVRPVVIGLLVWTAYDMAVSAFGAKKIGWDTALSQGLDKVLIAAGAFLVLTLTEIDPAIVIFAAAILGLVIYR